MSSTVCTCSGSGGSNGKQRGHVLVCLYGTFSDIIAIYLPLVLLCVVCINGHMPEIFSFSSLDGIEVANVSQSSKISTLYTLLIYRKDCSVND